MRRLFHDYGAPLERLSLWLPLFLSVWLVNGIIIKELKLFALSTVPLLAHYLFRSRSNPGIFLEKELGVGFRLAPFIAALYFFSELGRPDLALTLALANIFLDLYFLESRSSLFLIVKSLSAPLLMASLSLLGINSQLKLSSITEIYLPYCLLGLIPGTLVSARLILLNADIFSSLGWALGSSDKNEKSQPTNYSRLATFLLVIGPALPAMLLPFNYLPQSFLVSSFSFFIIPKIAEKIQTASEPETLKLTSINTLLLAVGLELTLFIATLSGY